MTAVEWLFEQYVNSNGLISLDTIKQAMEKEKEQIIDSVFFGIHLEYNKIDSPLERAEQYYNETFSNPSD